MNQRYGSFGKRNGKLLGEKQRRWLRFELTGTVTFKEIESYQRRQKISNTKKTKPA